MHHQKKISGNAMFIVLVVIAALATLTMAVSRSGEQDVGDVLTQTADDFDELEIFVYANHLSATIEQMVARGVDPDNLDFVLPITEPAYSTAPHRDKVFHPEGGGADYLLQTRTNIIPAYNTGFVISGIGTAAGDVVLAINIGNNNAADCRSINQRLHGDPTVPEVDNDELVDLYSGNAGDFTDGTTCPGNGCNGVPYQCVTNVAGGAFLDLPGQPKIYHAGLSGMAPDIESFRLKNIKNAMGGGGTPNRYYYYHVLLAR